MEQKRPNGKWKTIDSKKLSARSKYAFTVKPTTPGAKAYRVVKPREGNIRAGASPIQRVTLYRWIYLEDLTWPDYNGFESAPSYINGILFLHAIYAVEGYLGDADYVVMNLSRACTTVKGTVGLDDDSSSDAEANIEVSVDGVDLLNRDYTPGQSTNVSWDVRGDYRLRIDATGVAGESYSAIGGGKALCSF